MAFIRRLFTRSRTPKSRPTDGAQASMGTEETAKQMAGLSLDGGEGKEYETATFALS